MKRRSHEITKPTAAPIKSETIGDQFPPGHSTIGLPKPRTASLPARDAADVVASRHHGRQQSDGPRNNGDRYLDHELGRVYAGNAIKRTATLYVPIWGSG